MTLFQQSLYIVKKQVMLNNREARMWRKHPQPALRFLQKLKKTMKNLCH